jgi:hypothetical protein
LAFQSWFLIRQVLVSGVFTHLNASSSDYSRVVGARLRLHTEEFLKQYSVGFDPHKGFAEVDEDGDMKNSNRVQVQVLDTVVLEETLEEVARWGTPRSTNRANMGTSPGFFSIRYGSPTETHHMSISISRRNPRFTSANKSSVYALDFFHSLFGLGRREDVGGDESRADPSTSLRDLFFPAPAPAFAPLDGEEFILQVHRVFTRILLVSLLVASSGSAHRSADYGVAAVARVAGLLARSTPMAATMGNGKP